MSRPYDFQNFNIMDFSFEIVMIVLLAAYTINYFVGSAANKRIAKKWLSTSLDFIDTQFATVGNQEHKLLRDTPRDYILFATGRINCMKMYCQLHLDARHDLFFNYVESWYGGVKENATFTVTFNEDDCGLMCFGIVKKNLVSSYLKERWDLDNFTKQSTPKHAPQDYTIMSDCPELMAQLVQIPLLQELLGREDSVIEKITMTDLPAFKPETVEGLAVPKELVVVCSLKDMDQQRQATELVIQLIDAIASFKFTAEQAQRAKVLRQGAVSAVLKVKEEERKKELADKKYKEKKEKMDKLLELSPAAQRKAEEKLKKQELKKNLKMRTKKA